MFRSAGETVADVFRLFLPFKNLNELKPFLDRGP